MNEYPEDDYDLKPFLTSVHARTSRRIVQKYFENQIEQIEQHGLYVRYVDTFVKIYELNPVVIDPKKQNPLVSIDGAHRLTEIGIFNLIHVLEAYDGIRDLLPEQYDRGLKLFKYDWVTELKSEISKRSVGYTAFTKAIAAEDGDEEPDRANRDKYFERRSQNDYFVCLEPFSPIPAFLKAKNCQRISDYLGSLDLEKL